MADRLNELITQLKQSPERVDEVLVSYRKRLHKTREDIHGYRRGIEQYEANIERLEALEREYKLMIELFEELSKGEEK